MNKNEIKLQIKRGLQKRVVLFGADSYASGFYLKYKDIFNISHSISSFEEQWGEKVLAGELDVRPYNPKDIDENTYVIICGRYVIRTVFFQFLRDGFSIYKDFIDYRIAEAVYSEKEIILFRGSCVLRDVYDNLVNVKAFNDKYVGVFVQDKQATTKYENPLLLYTAKICDLYIYSHRVMSTDAVYRIQPQDLPEGVEMISVSNQTFSGYWPQAVPDITHRNDYWIHGYDYTRDMLFYHNMFMFEDRELNRLVDEGLNAEEIYKKVSSTDYFSDKIIKRTVSWAKKSMQIADNGADVKMFDFINDNYKNRRVYQNFDHMDKCVIWEYVRRVLTALHLDISETYHLEEISPRYTHTGGDIPIYPCVIDKLELSWLGKEPIYEVVSYDGVFNLSFEEYVNTYVEYTVQAKKIMSVW